MNFVDELGLLIRARYPVIYLPTAEEERAEAAIAASAQREGGRAVYTWDFVEGYQGNPNDAGTAIRNPLQALEHLEKLPAGAAAIFVLRDFHRFLEDIAVARKLRNLARLLRAQPKTLVILSPQLVVPDDLAEIITVVEFALPTPVEIKGEIERLLASMGRQGSGPIDDIVRSCQGLSLDRIRRVLA
ncbi:AAA family ATPase, partial [filamentous cyanobacterium CCP5]